jgi:cobalt-zinc-cadmium efflux system membrane fusion protein
VNRTSTVIVLILVLVQSACGRGSPSEEADEHAHDEAAEHADGSAAEVREGAHGGRVLEHDGIAVELGIAEDGTPPRFQAWLYRGDEPVAAGKGRVEVRLVRLGGAAETHRLVPRPDGSLMAETIVGEPHSFEVEVHADVDGQSARWAYPSYEGRTEIAAEIAREAGIRVAPIAAGTIADEHEVQGLLTPIDSRVARVAARFPGVVRKVGVEVGDRVRAGAVLATIDSNLSLTSYPVVAPIDGVVLARDAAVGTFANESATLFEIADLSSLWVDLHVFGRDAEHIQAGAPVEVTRLSDGATAATTLERVLPGTATASQSTIARATLKNTDGLWRPGSAVKARIVVAQQPATLVVPLSALQTFRDWDVVFVRVGDVYEVRPVELGQRDGRQVEIRSGVAGGDQVVTEQSFLVKADIEKSGASHDH